MAAGKKRAFIVSNREMRKRDRGGENDESSSQEESSSEGEPYGRYKARLMEEILEHPEIEAEGFGELIDWGIAGYR